MRKYLLVVVSIAFGYLYTNAQSLEIYTNREVLVTDNQEITVPGNITTDMIVEHFKVKNISGAAIPVKIRKQILEIHGNSISTFCWGVCYPPNINESSESVTIDAGSFSAGTLDAELEPDTQTAGVSRVAFTAFNANNPNDSARFIVKFDVLASTPEALVAEFKLFPNPTEGELTISGGEGKQLTIYNAIGQKMGMYNITANDEKLDISSLKSGIYLALLSENGNTISTRKLIKR